MANLRVGVHPSGRHEVIDSATSPNGLSASVNILSQTNCKFNHLKQNTIDDGNYGYLSCQPERWGFTAFNRTLNVATNGF